MKLWSHEGQPIFVERAASPTPPKTIKVTALEGIVTGIEPGSDFEYANLDRNIVIVSSPEPQTTTARTWPKRPEFREFEALLKDCAGLLREILSKGPIGERIQKVRQLKEALESLQDVQEEYAFPEPKRERIHGRVARSMIRPELPEIGE